MVCTVCQSYLYVVCFPKLSMHLYTHMHPVSTQQAQKDSQIGHKQANNFFSACIFKKSMQHQGSSFLCFQFCTTAHKKRGGSCKCVYCLRCYHQQNPSFLFQRLWWWGTPSHGLCKVEPGQIYISNFVSKWKVILGCVKQ